MADIFKYKEDEILKEIHEYVGSTYGQHYVSSSGEQALDLIMASSESLDFLTGNAIKYLARFGKKAGHNRNDLLKAAHYVVLALYFYDKIHRSDVQDKQPRVKRGYDGRA